MVICFGVRICFTSSYRLHISSIGVDLKPGKYLLFFKSGQADAMTACFSEYSRKVLDKAKSRQPTIPEQMKQAEQQLAKEKPPKEHIKEVSHDR